MPAQRFTYTVSGIFLTDEQKVRISEEIAATVTRVLLGETPAALYSAYLAEHPLCGGSHLDRTLDDEPVEEVDLTSSADRQGNGARGEAISTGDNS